MEIRNRFVRQLYFNEAQRHTYQLLYTSSEYAITNNIYRSANLTLILRCLTDRRPLDMTEQKRGRLTRPSHYSYTIRTFRIET